MQTVTAVAHRGDPYRFRENTLDSLRSALRLGADAVEVDVRLTRDGVPVLLHDDTLNRLWEHDRPLRALTAAEVREVTGGRVPTLAEALAATDGSRVMLDLPGTREVRTARRVVDAVREAGAQDRVYYCADAEAMLAVRGADPSAEIALTCTSLAPRVRRCWTRSARAGSTTAGPWWTAPSRPASTTTGCCCRCGPRHPPLHAPPDRPGRGLDHHQPRRRPVRAEGSVTEGRATGGRTTEGRTTGGRATGGRVTGGRVTGRGL